MRGKLKIKSGTASRTFFCLIVMVSHILVVLCQAHVRSLRMTRFYSGPLEKLVYFRGIFKKDGVAGRELFFFRNNSSSRCFLLKFFPSIFLTLKSCFRLENKEFKFFTYFLISNIILFNKSGNVAITHYAR